MSESKFTIKPVMNVDDVIQSANKVRKIFEELSKSIDGKPLSKELSSVKDAMEETVRYMSSYEKSMKEFQKRREETAKEGIAAEKQLEVLEEQRLELQAKKANLFKEIDKAEEAGDTESLKALNAQLADVNLETQRVRESFEEARATISYVADDASNLYSLAYQTQGVEVYRDNLKESTQYLTEMLSYWNEIVAKEQQAATEQAKVDTQAPEQAKTPEQDIPKASPQAVEEQVSLWKQYQQQIEANTETIIGYQTAAKALGDAGLNTKEIQEQIEGLKLANEALSEMQGNVGNIQLSDIFDKGDIEGTAERLRNHIQNITDSVEGTDLPSKLQSIADKLETLSIKSTEVAEDMKHLEGKGMGDSAEYQDLEKKAMALNTQMRLYVEKWNEAVAKMKEAGAIPTPIPGGQSGGGDPTEEAALLRDEYTAANRALMSLTTSTRSLGLLLPGVSTRGVRGVTMLTRAMLRLSTMSKGQVIKAIQAVGKAISTVLSTIMKHPIVLAIAAVIAALAALVKMVKKTKEEVEAMGKAFLKGLSSVSKTLAKFTVSMGKGFLGLGAGVIKSILSGLNAIVDKIKSIKSVITENIKLMAKWNNGNNAVNKAMTNLTSSLAYLKAAFTSAFVPILTVVEPIITRLVDKLAELMTMIGMFMAKLSGASTFQKAIKVQKDYAKALNGTGSAAKKTLASFDELNVLNGDKGGGEAVDWEEVEMAKVEIPDLIAKMRELGNTVGTKIRDMLNDIPWDKVKEGAEYAAKAITAFVNALFDVSGLGKAVGTALAELGNTFVLFTNELLTGINFGRIGEQLGQMFQQFLDTFEFDKLGQVWSNSLNAVADVLYNFFNNMSGADLGKGITAWFQNAFGRIDWTTIRGAVILGVQDIVGALNEMFTSENFSLLGKSIAELFNTAFLAIKEFTENADWEQWGQGIADGINKLFDSFNPKTAGTAISDLAHGLLDMLLKAVEEINWDDVSEKLVEFVSSIDWKGLGAKAKEISTKLMEALREIWAALEESGAFDDIIELIVDVMKEKKNWEKAFKKIRNEVIREVIVEKITNALQNIWDAIIEGMMPKDDSEVSGQSESIGKMIVEGIIAGFTGAMGSTPAFQTLFDWIWGGICQIFGIHSPAKEMEPVGENIVNGILEGFGLVDVGQALTEWWDTNIAPWFSLEKWKGIANNVKTALATKMDEIKTNLTTKWDNLTSAFTEKLEILKEIFSLKFEAIKNNIVDAVEAIKEGIKTPINGIISLIESLINYIINGINGLTSKLGNVNFDVPDWVPEIGGKNFNISIPQLSTVSIPRLAQGAVLPPNAPFLAMLGDQKSGTNVEAPLETIKQALADTMQSINFGGGSQPINIYLGTELIYSEIRKLEKRNAIIGG